MAALERTSKALSTADIVFFLFACCIQDIYSKVKIGWEQNQVCLTSNSGTCTSKYHNVIFTFFLPSIFIGIKSKKEKKNSTTTKEFKPNVILYWLNDVERRQWVNCVCKTRSKQKSNWRRSRDVKWVVLLIYTPCFSFIFFFFYSKEWLRVSFGFGATI